MGWNRVFHATRKGNSKYIKENGWSVERHNVRHGQYYGRGIYFWEKEDDAHTFGQLAFGNNYEIVEEEIPIRNAIKYDHNKAYGCADSKTKSLMSKGYELMVVTNPVAENITMTQAKGKIYVWLVDVDGPDIIVQ